MRRKASLLAPVREVGLVDDALAAELAADPLAYGLKANRPILDALFDSIYEQGPRRAARPNRGALRRERPRPVTRGDQPPCARS